MALFLWDERFSVGVTELDNEHKGLIDLMNQLSDSMLSGNGQAVLQRTLDSLVEYTKVHFTNEERKMAETGYPELAEHHAEHQRLIAQVAELQERVHRGMKPTIETMQFLKSWLTNHISKTDRRYTKHMNDNGIK